MKSPIMFAFIVAACAPSATHPTQRTTIPTEDEVETICQRPSAECEQLCVRDGVKRACVRMTVLYSGNPGVPDPIKQVAFAERACRAGDIASCKIGCGYDGKR